MRCAVAAFFVACAAALQGGAAAVRPFDFTGAGWEGASPTQAGFILRDARARNSRYRPFAEGMDSALGLSLTVVRRKAGDAEFFDVTLSDTTGEDRALTLVYAVPLPSGEVTWHAHPRSNATVRAEMKTLGNFYSMRDIGRRALSRHPFVAVSGAGGAAFALGIDVAYPAFYRAAVDPGLNIAYLAWDVGFVKGKQTAELRFVRFPFEAKHGFRGALEVYQQLYPENWEVRIKRQGTLLSFTNASTIPNCDDFGFRFKEAIYEPDFDDAHGILSFHYEEPLMWWMKKPGKDTSYQAFIDEANRLADAGDPRAKGWRESVFLGQDGVPLGRIRNMTWCDGIGWTLNTSPHLPGAFTDFNVRHGDGRFEARYRADWTPENPRGVDGEFIDSSEPYEACDMDFARTRFVHMRTPLCWCSMNGAVGIFKGMVAFENAREMKRRCRAIGRYIYANSTPNCWSWMPPNMDAMCREVTWVKRDGSWQPDDSELMMRRRMMCGGKPYGLEMNCDFDLLSQERVEKFFNHCLAYGFFPGFFSAAAHGKKNKERYFRRPDLYERDRPLFKRYIPLMRRVAEAGWRPVNRLFPVDPATGVFAEQFGDRYVTLFNPSQTDTRRITVPASYELMSGAKVVGEMFLPPETCRVLDFAGPEEFTTVIHPLEGEKWWGGSINDGEDMPYDTLKSPRDLRTDNRHGTVAPFLVSSAGRYVWSDRPFTLSASNGVLTIVSRTEKVEPVVAGKTLREAYLTACRRHFRFNGKIPAELLFAKPQWNNWMEIAIHGMKQSSVDAYTDELAKSGFPCGVYMMDGGWFSHMGSYEFYARDFPDPKGMFDRIRANGWKSMIWTAHFVSPDSREYKMLRYGPGYMIEGLDVLAYRKEPASAARRRQTGVVWWWSGISAIYDLTYGPGIDVYVKTLKDFAARYGIDGFKFDAGDTMRLCDSVRFHDAAKEAVDYAYEYVKVGAEHFPYNEYRCGFRTGGMPVMQRLHDQRHSWKAHAGVSACMQAAGLLGSPYVVADMIGGGCGGEFRPGGNFSEKLFIRSCAQQALHPMMQFSAAPWRHLSPEGVEICRAFANLHVEFGPYILDLAKHASLTGEPILRSMEYEFPHKGFTRAMTQFMLGSLWLVAPVVSEDDSLTVELPAGRWRDDLGEVHEGPKCLGLKSVPLSRLPRYERL